MVGERVAERRPRSEVQGAEGEAVVGRLEGHHSGPPGGQQRALDGHFDGVAAGDREIYLRLVDRRPARQPPRQLDPQRMGMDVSQPVQQAARLAADGRHDARVAVADRRHPEAGREIDVAVAVDVEDVGAARLRPEQGRRDAVRQGVDPGRLPARQPPRQGPRPRPWRRRHDLRRQIATVERRHGLDPTAHTAQISRRPASERARVTSSVYSMSPPTGMPKASRVTVMPRGLSSRAR